MGSIELRSVMFLSIAVLCLISGLVIYFKTAKKGESFSAVTAYISMMLIAIFPVILLFSFDPESSATGEYFGFTLGGAIAAFVVIWYFGTTGAINAQKIDDLNDKVEVLNAQIQDAHTLADQEGKKKPPQPINKTAYFEYQLREQQEKIVGIITGNLINVKGVDIWVNSENTNMQMARFYERSISGLIRYHGAKKDEFDEVSEDLIADELAAKMKGRRYVKPAVVLTTDSGELRHTHGVKMIYHCASANGQIGVGYRAIEQVESCVANALNRMDEQSDSDKLNSIVFPIMGTGRGRAEPAEVIEKLISTAIGYLKNNPESKVQKIYFLAFTDQDLVYCQRSFDNWDEDVAKV